jgi:leucyl aminopeptidase (aminopeptidase T)
MSLEELDEILVPALAVNLEELQAEIGRVLAALAGHEEITIETGDGHRLTLQLGTFAEGNQRIWLPDDGYIDEEDRERGAIVSNLPAGSVYTTVIESETEGSIALAKASPGEGVVFTFRQGRIEEIEAAKGKKELTELFDRHTGEPRRVSHFGIGLNPQLHRELGWIIPDEHIHGSLFLALGENRYMGGLNESSLNTDFVVAGATVRAGERVVVDEGKVVV